MLLEIQLLLLAIACFVYFIHLILMKRYVYQRTIINSFKTQIYLIIFIYFIIKLVQIVHPQLFSASAQEYDLLISYLYLGLATLFLILIAFNAVSANIYSELKKEVKEFGAKGFFKK